MPGSRRTLAVGLLRPLSPWAPAAAAAMARDLSLSQHQRPLSAASLSLTRVGGLWPPVRPQAQSTNALGLGPQGSPIPQARPPCNNPVVLGLGVGPRATGLLGLRAGDSPGATLGQPTGACALACPSCVSGGGALPSQAKRQPGVLCPSAAQYQLATYALEFLYE